MEQTKEKQEDRAVVMVEGIAYFEDTGEICKEQKFEIKDTKSVEWLLEKLQKLDSELLSLKALKKAQTENITTMQKAIENNRKWLEFRFKPELEKYVFGLLPRTKAGKLKIKTHTTPYGKVSFRDTSGKFKVSDVAKAKNFCDQVGIDYEVEIVKTENVTFNLKEMEAIELADGETWEQFGIEFEEAVENVGRIDTGVK
jgi:methionyl-tRNA formyltransferase